MRLRILHTNDLHGALTPDKATKIRGLKREGLLFDSGDCIKAGNLAIPLKPDPAWALLAEAGCDVGTIGNRESQPLKAGFEAKLRGHQHPLVCANLYDKEVRRPLAPFISLEHDGVKIAVLGVMVPMVTSRMKTALASAFLWTEPIAEGAKLAREVRDSHDVVIALTHIGNRQDLLLAESAPEIDIILGGHSHTIMESPQLAGRTWIAQGGSHARFVGEYEFDGTTLKGGLVDL